MSLGTRILLIVGLLGLALAGHAGWLAVESHTLSQQAARHRQMNAVAGQLAAAAGALAKERGHVNGMLADVQGADQTMRATTAALRSEAETALQSGLQGAIGFDLAPVQRAHAALAGLRGRVDRAMQAASADAPTQAEWFAAATSLIDAVVILRRALDGAGDTGNDVSQLVIVRDRLAEMAEFAGRERGFINGLIAANAHPSPAQRVVLGAYSGRIDGAWMSVRKRLVAASPDLRVAIAAAERAWFTEFAPLRESVLAAAWRDSRDGEAGWPVTPAAWFRSASPGIDALLAAEAVTTHDVEAALAADETRMAGAAALAAALLVAVVALVAFSVWYLRVRVVRPLRVTTQVIDQLAAGVVDVELPERRGSDEVAQLVAAATHFRQMARAARAAVRQQENMREQAEATRTAAVVQEAREHAQRTALESTTDSVIVLDRSWRYTYLNERAKMRLAPGRDLLGQVIWEAVPSLAGTAFADAYRAAMEHGMPTQVGGYYAPLKTHFEAHAYPSRDGLTVFYRDVTEERRIAAELRQTEGLFQATFNQAAVGMAQVGLDGTWLRVNDKLCEITGYTREGLLAGRFQDITHSDDQPADIAPMKALLAGEIEDDIKEKRYLHKDGGIRWVTLTGSLLRDAEGRPERFIAVMQDITERKRIETALRESDARLQLAREAAGFGIWEWDMVTGVVIWSEEEWRLHGLTPRPENPDLATWLGSLHPEDRERVWAEERAVLDDPDRIFDTEYRVILADGQVRWLLARARVLRDAAGQPLRMVGLNMDITAIRATETALRRLTEDLETRVRAEVAAREAAQARAAHAERMQALGELAGGIAHDFNNVLQAVHASGTLIAQCPADAEAVQDYARIVVEAADRGASVTRRLLAFARRGDLRAEAIDPVALLQGMREVLEHTLGGGVTILIGAEAGLPQLLADRSQLETALVNLAVNARDAMPQGGTLTLSAAAEVLTQGGAHRAGLAAGRYVRIAVADAGAGMDTATLARAFQPFFTTKLPGQGTGLGLAMVKGFAEQSGGGVAIDSTSGQGTTVTIWLPQAAAGRRGPAAGAATRNDAGASDAGGTRVLVVDDNPLVLRTLAAQLRRQGFEVTAAPGGLQALGLLDAGLTVDAIISDLTMAGLDGISLIREAQARHPGLAAILLTGYVGDAASLGVGRKLNGPFAVMQKPSRGADLANRISALRADPAWAGR